MSRLLDTVHKLRALRSFHGIIQDPTRLDLVLQLVSSSVVNGDAPQMPAPMREFVDSGRRTPALDLEALGRLPEGSLGREVAEQLRGQDLDPNDLEHSPHHPEFESVAEHMGRTHDVHHAVTGFGTDVPGEVGLQMFYLANIGMPSALVIGAAALLGPLVRGEDMEQVPALMDAMTEGWQRGKRARCLFGIDWSAHWARPLDEVRAELGLAA